MLKTIPTITICTDASFLHYEKTGAWACYIRTPDQTIRTSGILKGTVLNSTHAEKLGIANALFIANMNIDISSHKLIVYCDNKSAYSLPGVNKTPQSKYYKKQKSNHTWYKDNIQIFLDKAIEYETRHVKGHLPQKAWDTVTKKHYMNDWCDKEAKRLTRLYRQKIKEEQLNENIN